MEIHITFNIFLIKRNLEGNIQILTIIIYLINKLIITSINYHLGTNTISY